MKRLLQALLVSIVATTNVAAQDRVVVVELYTSQGCSSCPPADDMMEVLAERDDVIALSLHVDYWDYIGWKDEFADPRNAERQRAYAQMAGRRSVYTPEMIVNGVSEIVGAKPMKLASAIDRHKTEPQLVELTVKRKGTKVQIQATNLAGKAGPMTVQMLRYQPRRNANITRGENAGRIIDYVNVTQDWQSLGVWEGQSDLRLVTEAPGELPVVILIQAGDIGPILAASQVK